MKIVKSAATTALFFGFTGCMSSSREEAINSSIIQMQGQILQLQKGMDRQSKAIIDMREIIMGTKNDARSAQAQAQLTQGSLDEFTMRIKKVEEIATAESGKTIVSDVDEDKVLGLQVELALLKISLNTKDAVDTQKTAPKIKTAAELNKTLSNLYENQEFNQLIATATHALKVSPGEKALTRSALEYRAEAYFALKDYARTIKDYAFLIEKYPETGKYSRALLIMGDSFVSLKQMNVAKYFYKACADKFANTPIGNAAQTRLNSLVQTENAH